MPGDLPGALFRVDPVSGARALLSDFGQAGPNNDQPLGQEPEGHVLRKRGVLTWQERWALQRCAARAGLS